MMQVNAMAQADSLVKVNAKASPLNDSTYQLSFNIQVNQGWHVYSNTPSPDNKAELITTSPKIVFKLETVKFLNELSYSSKSSFQKDVLFEKANIFEGSITATQNFTITGFQPDTLKGNLVIALAKGNEFYEQEIPVSIFLANGKKTSGVQFLLPATATTPPDGACGEAAHDSKESSGWTVFVLGFLGGLIALITPCVFPMIPVTVSFFTKRSKTRKQGIKNGLLYGLSIFLIYVLASVPFHLLGNVQPEIFNII